MSGRVAYLRELGDPDHDVRLAAARALALAGTPEDIDALRAALAKEDVAWVQTSLREAISVLAESRPASSVGDDGGLAGRLEEESYARALEDITRQLAHELSPLIGAVDFFAAEEIEDYDSSQTERALARLRRALDALRDLSKAAKAPAYIDFPLGQVIHDITEAECPSAVTVNYSGRDDLVVEGDQRLVELAVSNGLRNAFEATEALANGDPDVSPILAAWGATDTDNWVSIRDEAAGLPPSYTRAFELGVSNKGDHLGMGLAIALRAATSLSGSISLEPAEGVGALFQLRWPKRPARGQG